MFNFLQGKIEGGGQTINIRGGDSRNLINYVFENCLKNSYFCKMKHTNSPPIPVKCPVTKFEYLSCDIEHWMEKPIEAQQPDKVVRHL